MTPLCRFLLLPLLAACASGCAAHGARGGTPLFTLEDPRGDDHGDGELRYPLREDLEPGALDLLSFRAFAEKDGTRFEATFARPIARPQQRTVDSAGTTQAALARLGFYTFNLDVYVDEDRQEGSGRTDTLPGRFLTLTPGSAWEKVILLTPRPYEARDMLRKLWRDEAIAQAQQRQGSVSGSAASALEEQVERRMEAQVFFATRVNLFGPTVSFFVPGSFLGGPASPSWGYAVAVTGARLERRVELPALFGPVTAPPEQGLMVLGIGAGVSRERFGGGRVAGGGQSPVVDLLVPAGVRQEAVLGPEAPGWPAVVPVPPALPQAPDAGGTSGQGDAPGALAPQG